MTSCIRLSERDLEPTPPGVPGKLDDANLRLSGFHARVVQHECDRLHGVLYPIRIRDFIKFGFNDALFPGQALPAEE